MLGSIFVPPINGSYQNEPHDPEHEGWQTQALADQKLTGVKP